MKEVTLRVTIGIDEEDALMCDPECGYYSYSGHCMLFNYPLEGLAHARCQDCLDAEGRQE